MMTTDQINTEEFERGVRAARNWFRVSNPNRNTIVVRFHEIEDGSFDAMTSGDLNRWSYLLGMESVFGEYV